MGYTGAPIGDPTPINKTIARCAKNSEGLYQQGTTWFTDGTSGWTQTCAGLYWDKAWEPEPAPDAAWDEDDYDEVIHEEWNCIIDEYGDEDCWQVY